MIRLVIVVEGKTEKEFVDRLLAVHLSGYGVAASARLLGKPRYKGGSVTVERIARDVRNLVNGFDAVTTLVDFYGFRQRPTDDIDELQRQIDLACRNATNLRLRDDRVFAYVQRHEFEALLFSEPDAFERSIALPTGATRTLRSVRASFATPEDINDSRETAPSKRLLKAIPGYSKGEFGWLVAESIGLETIRQQCPRFNRWLSRLEQIGNA